MDDAHENQVLDRQVTRKSFETSLFLEKGGFIVAAAIVAACLTLMAVSVFVYENLGGAALFGLSAVAPVVLGFLGNRRRPPDT